MFWTKKKIRTINFGNLGRVRMDTALKSMLNSQLNLRDDIMKIIIDMPDRHNELLKHSNKLIELDKNILHILEKLE